MKPRFKFFTGVMALILVMQTVLPVFATDNQDTFATEPVPKSETIKMEPKDQNVEAEVPKKEIYATKEEDFEIDPFDGSITGFSETFLAANHENFDLVLPEKVGEVFVNRIEPFAFYNVKGIHSIDFTKATQLETIEPYAFSFTLLNSIDLSKNKNLKRIGQYAFVNSQATEILLPEGGSLETVEKGAFGNSLMGKDFLNKVFDELEKKDVEYLKSFEDPTINKAGLPKPDRNTLKINREDLEINFEVQDVLKAFDEQMNQFASSYNQAREEAKAQAETGNAKEQAQNTTPAKVDQQSEKREVPVEVQNPEKSNSDQDKAKDGDQKAEQDQTAPEKKASAKKDQSLEEPVRQLEETQKVLEEKESTGTLSLAKNAVSKALTKAGVPQMRANANGSEPAGNQGQDVTVGPYDATVKYLGNEKGPGKHDPVGYPFTWRAQTVTVNDQQIILDITNMTYKGNIKDYLGVYIQHPFTGASVVVDGMNVKLNNAHNTISGYDRFADRKDELKVQTVNAPRHNVRITIPVNGRDLSKGIKIPFMLVGEDIAWIGHGSTVHFKSKYELQITPKKGILGVLVNGPLDYSGSIPITVNGEKQILTMTDGIAKLKDLKTPVGTTTVSVQAPAGLTVAGSSKQTVEIKENEKSTLVFNLDRAGQAPQKGSITCAIVESPQKDGSYYSGSYTLEVDGQQKPIQLENGRGTVTFKDVRVGEQIVKITIPDGYVSDAVEKAVKVNPGMEDGVYFLVRPGDKEQEYSEPGKPSEHNLHVISQKGETIEGNRVKWTIRVHLLNEPERGWWYLHLKSNPYPITSVKSALVTDGVPGEPTKMDFRLGETKIFFGPEQEEGEIREFTIITPKTEGKSQTLNWRLESAGHNQSPLKNANRGFASSSITITTRKGIPAKLKVAINVTNNYEGNVDVNVDGFKDTIYVKDGFGEKVFDTKEGGRIVRVTPPSGYAVVGGPATRLVQVKHTDVEDDYSFVSFQLGTGAAITVNVRDNTVGTKYSGPFGISVDGTSYNVNLRNGFGTITLDSLAPGQSTFLVKAPAGYQITSGNEEYSVYLSEGDNGSLEYTMIKNEETPTTANGRLIIPGYTGKVQLTVTDSNKRQKTYPQVTVTNGGPALVENLPLGTCTVQIAFTDGTQLVQGEKETKTFIFRAGAANEMTWYVQPPQGMHNWTIKVVENVIGGRPVSGATVTAVDANGESKTGTTGSNGIVVLQGAFHNKQSYTVSVSKNGYISRSDKQYFEVGRTRELPLVKEQSAGNRTFNFIVQGPDKKRVQGTTIAVVDDRGRHLTGVTDQRGTLALNGDFTPGKQYEITIVGVPSGYKLPSAPIKNDTTKFSPKAFNPRVSHPVTITLEKSDHALGEMTFMTVPNDTEIVVGLYQGDHATGNPWKEIHIPANSKGVKVGGLTPYQKYTVKVLEDKDNKYGTGGTSTFVYKPTEPYLVIHLSEKVADGTFVIRIHEGSATGPLSTRMDGQTITMVGNGGKPYSQKLKKGTLTYTGVPFGERFDFPQGKTPIAPVGYRLVYNVPVQLSKSANSGYQDWVLVKTTGNLYLTVEPPKGFSFPDNMTVTVTDERGSAVRGPVPIGNGHLTFSGIPQGRTYNITYQNVPEHWTHDKEMKVPFRIPLNAIETTVHDRFGYENPQAKYSQISISVKDRDGNPVGGYVFDVNGPSGKVATLTTDQSGVAYKSFENEPEGQKKLAPGTYTVVNTKAAEGYNKVSFPTVQITKDKFNIALDAVVSKQSQGMANLDIKVVDEQGNPVPYEWLELHKNGQIGLYTDQLQTDSEGRTYVRPIHAGTYYFTLKPESTYELIEQEGQSKNVVIHEGEDKQVILTVRPKAGQGRIQIQTLSNGRPVSVKFIVKDAEGRRVPLGYSPTWTSLDGSFLTKYLKNGTYTVELQPTPGIYKEGYTKTKTVQVNNGIAKVVFDDLEKKEYEVGNAGSLQIAGTILENEAKWTVTVTKDATQPGAAPGAKRGTINTIRFSDKEMVRPKNLKLIRIEGEGDQAVKTEVPINGQFIHANGYYELVDDQSQDKTSTKVQYVYTFDATALPDPPATKNPENPGEEPSPGYSLYAKTKIVSTSPLETIPAVEATKKLDLKEATNVNMSAKGFGVADRDSSLRWKYDITTESSTKGTFRVVVEIPEGEEEFQKGFSDPVGHHIKLIDKKTQTAVEVPIRREGNKIFIDIPAVPNGGEQNYELQVLNQWKSNNIPEENYKQKVTLQFVRRELVEGRMQDVVKKETSFIAEAQKVSMPPGDSKNLFFKGCENGKDFQLYMQGNVSADNRSISWTVRATNMGSNSLRHLWPIDLNMTVPKSLGPMENVQIKSSATAFPYIASTSVENDAQGGRLLVRVGDQNGGHPLTKNISGSTQAEKLKNLREVMPYIYWDRVKSPAELFSRHQWAKLDDSNNKGVGFARNFQRLGPGDYVEVTFSTPVKDFTKLDEGFALTTNLGVYDFKYLRPFHYPNETACNYEGSLTIKSKKYLNNVKSCTMTLDKYGKVVLTGRYSTQEDIDAGRVDPNSKPGQAIIWTIQPITLKSGGGDLSANRRFDIDLQFVKKEGANPKAPAGSLTEIGLKGGSEHRYPHTTSVKSKNTDPLVVANVGNGIFDGEIPVRVTQSNGGLHYNIRANYSKPSHSVIFAIVTPLEPGMRMEDYRLKISGKVSNHLVGAIDNPLKNPMGGTECVCIVEGTILKPVITKKWVNILEGQALPKATFEIWRSADGQEPELVDTFEYEEKAPHRVDGRYVYDPNGYERYTEGGFPAAKKEFKIENDKFLIFNPETGLRYHYFVKERPMKGWTQTRSILEGNAKNTLITNTRVDGFDQGEDPTEYVTDKEGTYPKNYRQDGPDIRNAYTELDRTERDEHQVPRKNDSGEPYKIEYEDSIVGKSGQQTDIPGEFDMKLTVEGKGSGYSYNGVDVVFVMDNSGTMRKRMGSHRNGTPGVDRKIDIMRKEMSDTIHKLLDLNQPATGTNAVRVGLVNFATDVDPVGNAQRMKDGTGRWTGVERFGNRPAGRLTYAKPSVELSSSWDDLQFGIPIDQRSIDGATGTGYQFFDQVDGQTNVQAGIREGVRILYPDKEQDHRKKYLVVISDGAPSAHYRMSNTKDPSKDTNVITNLAFWYLPRGNNYMDYYTKDGVLITGNALPTLYEMDYQKKKHQDMEVLSISMDPQGGNDNATLDEQLTFLKQLTTNPEENFYTAYQSEEFTNALLSISNKLKVESKTIMDGIVTDPMGEMLRFKDYDGDGALTPASSPELKDGDFYLADNFGTHLNSNGVVVDQNGKPVPDLDNKKRQPIIYTKIPIYTDTSRYEWKGYVDIAVVEGQGIWMYKDHKSVGPWKLNSKSNDYGGQLRIVAHNNRAPAIPIYAANLIGNAAEAKRLFVTLTPNSPSVARLAGADKFSNYIDLNHPTPQINSLLHGVTVVKDGDGFQIRGLNLGTGEEVKLLYKVNLKTDDPTFEPNVYYQNNKTTTLQPRPNSEDEKDKKIIRHFPIPSVKGPTRPIAILKKWMYNGTTFYYALEQKGNKTELVLKSDPVNAMGEEAEAFKKMAETLTAHFVLVRETATTPYKSSAPNDPASEEFKSVWDPNSKVVLREITLNKENGFRQEFDLLPAYNDYGHEYKYYFEERGTMDGWTLAESETSFGGVSVNDWRFKYNREEGTSFVREDGTPLTGTPVAEFTNSKRVELPMTGTTPHLSVWTICFGVMALLAAWYVYRKNAVLGGDSLAE